MRVFKLLIAALSTIIILVLVSSCNNNGNKNLSEELRKGSKGLEVSGAENEGQVVISGKGTNNDKDLVIPAFKDDQMIYSIADYAFQDCTEIKSLKIGADFSLTYSNSDDLYLSTYDLKFYTLHIGAGAFKGCTNLEKVTIMGRLSIDPTAFEGCTNLKTIEIGFDYYSSNYSIMTGVENYIAFSQFDNLSLVYLDGVAVVGSKGVTGETLLEQFGNSVTSIEIPKSVDSISYGISGVLCNLERIQIDSKNDKYMCFGNCIIGKNNKTLYMGCNNSVLPTDGSIETIGDYAFANCNKLTELSIPSSVTRIEYGAFSGCTSLENITIPEGVQIIGQDAFSGCSSLTSISLPDSLTTIMENAFEYCTGLKNIVIPSNVSEIDCTTFLGCSGLSSIKVKKDNQHYMVDGPFLIDKSNYSDALERYSNVVLFALHSQSEMRVPNYVDWIGEYAFSNNNVLTSIIFESEYCGIRPNAFYDCVNLKNVVLPTYSFSISDYTFAGCSSLETIELHHHIESIGDGAFANCYSLNSIVIPDRCMEIGDGAFENCKSLISVSIPEGVVKIGKSAFSGCISLTEITIPASVRYIGNYALSYCDSLSSIKVDDENSIFIDSGNCIVVINANNTIDTPDDDNATYVYSTDVYEYGALIAGCNNSTIPTEGFVKSIERGAFAGCKELTSITIPDSVNDINCHAFDECTSLESFYYMGTVEEWKNVSKVGYGNWLIKVGNDLYIGEKNIKDFVVHCSDGDTVFVEKATDNMVEYYSYSH